MPYPSPSVENISGFPRINAGYLTEPSEDDSEFNIAAYPYPNSTSNRSRSASPRKSEDPFAAQRGGDGMEGNPFRFEARDRNEYENKDEDEEPRLERACGKTDRRLSDESGVYPPRKSTKRFWLISCFEDASIASPTSSRTQHPKESVLATPSSRDSHDTKNHERDGKRHSGLVEKGWARMTGRSNKGEKG
jgi:hypothetical protein